jgi:hypothetical protein
MNFFKFLAKKIPVFNGDQLGLFLLMHYEYRHFTMERQCFGSAAPQQLINKRVILLNGNDQVNIPAFGK